MRSITKRYHHILLAVFSISMALGACHQNDQPGTAMPNIIVILADDLGYGDPTCYNPSSKVNTPYIDQLARRGMKFTDAHSNASVCTPTRYGLLTGRYAWRSELKRGVTWSYDSAIIEPDRTTIASMLKTKGYRTACIGKWHLGLNWQWNNNKVDFDRPFSGGPNDLGFDYFYGIAASLDIPPYAYLENDRVTGMVDSVTKGRTAIKFEGEYWRKGPTAREFDHYQVLPRLTGKAVSFISDHERNDTKQPFFLYVPLTAPHLPWLPLKTFKGQSQAGDYGDFVAMVDWAVGQIITTLDQAGIENNTLIFFTSDNGAHWTNEKEMEFDHRANVSWLGMKGDIWEGGHRVPFIVSWPGYVRPGSIRHTPISTTDILATCAYLTGYSLSTHEAEDSRSLLPVLLGETIYLDQPEIVHHSAHGVFSLRQGNWKYIEAQGSGGFLPPDKDTTLNVHKGQLYHLGEDPGETNNLYDSLPEVVQAMSKKLEGIKGA